MHPLQADAPLDYSLGIDGSPHRIHPAVFSRSLFALLLTLPLAGQTIVRLDPRLDQILAPGARVEKIADGFTWTEGPVWNRAGSFLLFSDVPGNRIHQWRGGVTRTFLERAGYMGGAPFRGREPGPNGLAFDREGRLVFCQHGERAIARLEPDGSRTTLAARFHGKRLNSPNDLVHGANGDLYFTDPPFGLPGGFTDPTRELGFSGVFRLTPQGRVDLLTRELEGPNGIAFAPDGKTVYLSDAKTTRWYAFAVRGDGALGAGKLLLDGAALAAGRPGSADGLKVDRDGNLFAAAPGGIWILAPGGTLLGRIELGAATGNCAWGEDGGTLFITSSRAVYRARVLTGGPRS